jgi:hypothetical protein
MAISPTIFWISQSICSRSTLQQTSLRKYKKHTFHLLAAFRLRSATAPSPTQLLHPAEPLLCLPRTSRRVLPTPPVDGFEPALFPHRIPLLIVSFNAPSSTPQP